MSAAFVHWQTYFCTTTATIVRQLPLTLLWGVEPPLVLARNGFQCSRVAFDVDRRIVAYVMSEVEPDLRAIVALIQRVHGDTNAASDAKAEAGAK